MKASTDKIYADGFPEYRKPLPKIYFGRGSISFGNGGSRRKSVAREFKACGVEGRISFSLYDSMPESPAAVIDANGLCEWPFTAQNAIMANSARNVSGGGSRCGGGAHGTVWAVRKYRQGTQNAEFGRSLTWIKVEK